MAITIMPKATVSAMNRVCLMKPLKLLRFPSLLVIPPLVSL
jgi:hypothetical protein